MRFEYLTDYERLCLTASADEIYRIYPRLSKKQIENDIKLMKTIDSDWERAKLRRFLGKAIGSIWRF